MGFPEQSRKRHELLLETVRALDNPTATAVGFGVAVYYRYEIRDVDALMQLSDEGHAVCEKEGDVFWTMTYRFYRGCLRAALPLARLLIAQDRNDEPRTLLEPLYDTITEGRDLADLVAARRILAALGA